jgi:hypothetical protein
MSEKKLKIEGLERALEGVPEDEREELRALIKETFSNVDPSDPNTMPGQLVRQLADGVKNCPDCGNLLTNGFTMQLPNIGGHGLSGKLVTTIECESCDCSFMQEAKS